MRLSMKALSVQTLFIMIFFILIVSGCSYESTQNGAVQAQETKINVEQRLRELGIKLKAPAPPVANYVNSVRSGNLVFLAGHGPQKADGTWMQGKVGRDMSMEEGNKAARLTGINMLNSLKAEIGDLNKVKRIVKVLGMVNSDESFTDQPKVMNGFSDLMVEVFGERGRHARAAVGMAQLPFGIPVEIEMIVEIEEE